MILAGDMGRISETINALAVDTRNLLKAAVEISYFSRGAWSYNDTLQVSALERDIMTEFINERLEAASKSPYPVF